MKNLFLTAILLLLAATTAKAQALNVGNVTISYNVLRIYEVRLNEILNYKQKLVGVSCIYAVSTSMDYEN